jgi:hypothetical protein
MNVTFLENEPYFQKQSPKFPLQGGINEEQDEKEI